MVVSLEEKRVIYSTDACRGHTLGRGCSREVAEAFETRAETVNPTHNRRIRCAECGTTNFCSATSLQERVTEGEEGSV